MRKFVFASLLALFVAGFPCARGANPTTGPTVGTSTAPPRLIMIIRHGEKPEESADGKRDENLTQRGYERAAALGQVIPEKFARPDFLIAAGKSAHSNRPVETITPLSKALDEPIDEELQDKQFAELAHKILSDPKYSDHIVLIAWHHGKIPELAHALGAADAPSKWEAAVYDRVWEIKFQDGKAKFEDLPQKALPGDSQK